MNLIKKQNLAQKTFKELHSFEKRCNESKYILDKYPEKIPIIIEKSKNRNIEDIPNINKKKFLVPNDLQLSQLIYIVRKRINIEPHLAIFFFINNELFPASSIIKTIYEEKKDEDGFLYITYSGESTFG
jgi:GABA(A) receptor-associated protein